MSLTGRTPVDAVIAAPRTSALAALNGLRAYLNDQVLGQESLVERLLVALLADGHLLVEGPPGLAKKRNGWLPPGQAKKWRRGHPLPADQRYHDLPRNILLRPPF